MRSRLLLVAIGLVAGLVLGSAATTAGVTPDLSDPHLVDRSDSFGGLETVRSGSAVYTYALGRVCLDQPGTATIDDVRPVETTGAVDVLDFGTTAPRAIGERRRGGLAAYATVADPAFGGEAPKEVTVICNASHDLRDVVVELRASKPPVAVAGFDIDYSVGSKHHSIRIATGFTVCTGSRDRVISEFVEDHDHWATVADCRA